MTPSRVGSVVLLSFCAVIVVTACGGGDAADDAPPVTSSAGAGGASGGAGGAGASAGGASGASAGKAGASGAGASGAAGSGGGTGGTGGTGGAGAGGAGASGSAGKGGGGAGGASGCKVDADCAAGVPPTVPANCATGKCDKTTGACSYVAKDLDGDGYGTNKCKSVDTSVTVVVGDDCDDTDPQTNPKGWDGPAGGGKPNHCNDGIDQDCSGADGDGELPDGTTCTCAPGDVASCDKDASGKPIAFPGGKPVGACKLGSKTCLPAGTWGPCIGAVEPASEICNLVDDDCDGQVDDAAVGQATFYLDADGDGHGDATTSGKVACFPPGPEWKKEIPNDDCSDGDATVYPGAWDGPEAAPTTYGITAAGLKADLFNCGTQAACLATPFGTTPIGTRVDYAIDYALGLGSIHPSLGADYWAARWKGEVVAGAAGTYTFHATADDGVRVIVKGTTLIDGWKLQGPTAYSGTIALTAGEKAPIEIDYFESGVGATIRVAWEGPGITKQVLRVVSTPTQGTKPDRCDGKDNNCDNQVDNQSVQDGALFVTCSSCPIGTAKACGTASVGICHPGASLCLPTGQWDATCLGEKKPESEICDTLDNNCDGTIDNPSGGCPCTVGQKQACGACGKGTQTCVGVGAWDTCTGDTPQAVYCRDEDGDGYCNLGNCQTLCPGSDPKWKLKGGQCSAQTDCNDNVATINPGAAEQCNGVDDNCANGTNDEAALIGPSCTKLPGTPCQATGNWKCVNGHFGPKGADPGVCSAPDIAPKPEVCDGVDNDCDGKVDDGVYLGTDNTTNAACFRCGVFNFNPYVGSTVGSTEVFQGDGTFATATKMYAKVDFVLGTNNYAGKMNANLCLLAVEQGADASAGAHCGIGGDWVNYYEAGQPRPILEVIGPKTVGGSFSLGSQTGYALIYSDTNTSTDSGTTTLSPAAGTLKSINYVISNGMGGIAGGNPSVTMHLAAFDCITVRIPPP